MSKSKRIGLVRQFSLQCETPTVQQRKQILKKQRSEDFVEGTPNDPKEPEIHMRISLSAKNKAKSFDRPPPAKVAWAEEKSPRKDDGIVAKKCAENVRPKVVVPPKIAKQVSVDKDSILYSRQDLAQRLKQAWKEQEKSKQNLNIFLTANDDQNEEFVEVPETDRPAEEKFRGPKIILPLKPDACGENNVKNVFQKRIRKAMLQKSVAENCYSPTRTADRNDTRCTAMVVPIVVDRKSVSPPPPRLTRSESVTRGKLSRQNTMEKEANNKPEDGKRESNDVAIRPSSTAASRRELFQKRTNSAFHGSVKKEANFRPPLVRASSVPAKPESPTQKFPAAAKRRVKTAKAKLKSGKSVDRHSGDEGENSGGRRRVQHCVSVNGEIETMISLLTPSASDNEDEEKPKSRPSSPTKSNSAKIDDKLETAREQKNFSLRKTVKSVSFQQSTIHAVRSFSASFPARRCSVAAALMSANKALGKGGGGGGQKIQEKRAPASVLEDEQSVPKRRLLRTKSAPSQQSVDHDDAPADSTAGVPEEDDTSAPTEPKTAEDTDAAAEEAESCVDPAAPKFQNPKEKQCWDLYRKMSGRGVAISFDTILRGMLTPTEYRLRRKPSLVPEDNCQIAEN